MIKAVLSTTNNNEPWAALVPFEVTGTIWSLELKTKYQHYKNLEKNPKAIIVFTKEEAELIMKATVELETISPEDAKAILHINWLRLVTAEGVVDIDGPKEIEQTLQKYI